MKSKLAILLATYNSQKFLEEQLASLQNQTNKDWILYIRDDGSTDNTLNIIEINKKQYPNIVVLDDSNKGLGAMKSFFYLLENVDAEYYMFCDHDDVWLPNKIEISLANIIKAEFDHPNKPVIVHTDLKVVNGNLEVIKPSFWKMSAIKPKIIQNENLIQVFNCVTGCTMIFNKEVKGITFPYVDQAPMHDWWIALQTIKKGGVVKHLEAATILYRQHGNNEVGARNISFYYFFNKIKDLQKTLEGHSQHIKFLKKINGLNAFQYYYYKLYYTILRKL
ncbi:glycosyltransferase family 2 protein [Flavobacterium plurextorum]|uniref:glycosyltransferase family 2 protein n=1 Tax=Flavobacterium TaxID=237 RepID=UPI00214D8C0C|nr:MULTISPECIES: glycosyltransferase family 2 protein [Flavobacterium]UUW09495.1 glycosyltransferase family 2 protein [Flavobacterium plurextorum]